MGQCFSHPSLNGGRLAQGDVKSLQETLDGVKVAEQASHIEEGTVPKSTDIVTDYTAQLDCSKAGLPYQYQAGPPLPPCEEGRLETVRALHLDERMQVEAPPDPEIENILKLVSSVFQAPNALVALFDDRRIFTIASRGGFSKGDFPWRHSLCAWTMASQNETIMVIPDATKDARFAENPYVKSHGGVRFYCGAPLVASNGHRLGTLCFADSKPRDMEAHQAMVLGNFAEMVVRHIEKDIALQLRSKDNAMLCNAYRNLKRAIDCFDHCVVLIDTTQEGWSIMYTNSAWDKLTGTSRKELPGSKLSEVLEVRSGALPDKTHCAAVAAGKILTIDFVRVKNTWVAAHGLDNHGSSNSNNNSGSNVMSRNRHSGPLIRTASERSAPSRSSGATRRLMLRLRPAGEGPLDDDAVSLAVPSWVAAKGINGSPPQSEASVNGYYFMTIEVVDSFTNRTTPLSSRLSVSSVSCSSPLVGLKLGQLLGTGSFGSVYSGTWCARVSGCVYAGTRVAVKVIDQDMRTLAASGVQMEALLGSELRHPHIVTTITYATTMTPHVSGNMFSDDTARSNQVASSGPRPGGNTPSGQACVLSPGHSAACTPTCPISHETHVSHYSDIIIRVSDHKREEDIYAPRDLGDDLDADHGRSERASQGGRASDSGCQQLSNNEGSASKVDGGDGVSQQSHDSSVTLNVEIGRYAVIQMDDDAPKDRTSDGTSHEGESTQHAQQQQEQGDGQSQSLHKSSFKSDFFTKLTDFDQRTPVPDSSLSANRPEPSRPNKHAIHQTWIVLEYCDKGSLQDAVDRGWFRTAPSQTAGPPNMCAITSTALEVSSALLYLHSHGIVHGDLSAWNVLLTTSGSTAMQGGRGFVAKVADFGLSRCLDVKTRIQTKTYGTITHQPPETLLHGMVSRETDTYSLGVLLWQMYTGSRPWAGMTHAQIIMAVASQISRLQFPEDTPQDYADLACSCLNYNVAKRPSMADICKALESMKAKYAAAGCSK